MEAQVKAAKWLGANGRHVGRSRRRCAACGSSLEPGHRPWGWEWGLFLRIQITQQTIHAKLSQDS